MQWVQKWTRIIRKQERELPRISVWHRPMIFEFKVIEWRRYKVSVHLFLKWCLPHETKPSNVMRWSFHKIFHNLSPSVPQQMKIPLTLQHWLLGHCYFPPFFLVFICTLAISWMRLCQALLIRYNFKFEVLFYGFLKCTYF